eukprot:CAMPEP_0195100772 /NCGR_PEP_ID=MMETSP0448-20130528/64723_1 /TAXON_ID=66468 /ORGANISM="Heterocapsa triquestra, Strain CCMP 448" /LENGTH=47 /DNA_ID= /DNA_START= /DNA_END= /DNA_ORIENTATION=
MRLRCGASVAPAGCSNLCRREPNATSPLVTPVTAVALPWDVLQILRV